MDNMDTILEELSYEVRNLQLCCEKILKDAYGDNTKIDFPIDICKVADSLDIKLMCDSLDLGFNSKLDKEIAQLRIDISSNGEKLEKIIMVDKKINNNYSLSNSYSDLERFAIAREIGKYIVNKDKYDNVLVSQESFFQLNLDSIPFTIPKLYCYLDDFKYEMCAMFLLIPMEQFLNNFSCYIDSISNSPVLIDKFFNQLAIETQIPYFELVNGYGWLKLCAYQWYEEYSNIKDDSKKLEKYINLF